MNITRKVWFLHPREAKKKFGNRYTRRIPSTTSGTRTIVWEPLVLTRQNPIREVFYVSIKRLCSIQVWLWTQMTFRTQRITCGYLHQGFEYSAYLIEYRRCFVLKCDFSKIASKSSVLISSLLVLAFPSLKCHSEPQHSHFAEGGRSVTMATQTLSFQMFRGTMQRHTPVPSVCECACVSIFVWYSFMWRNYR